MPCAAVNIRFSPSQTQTKQSVTGRKPALLQAQMASTYSVWVEPTGDFAGATAYGHVRCTLHTAKVPSSGNTNLQW